MASNMRDSITLNKCTKCKWYRIDSDFLKEGRKLKSCINCRTIDIKSRKKNLCLHGKQNCHCKACGGSSICEHGRRKYQCRDCGGSLFCNHGKRKNCCKECGGSSICEHGKQRRQCMACGGSSICEHGRRKYQCKICSNPIELSVRNWLYNCRGKDKKYDRYDPDHFIDKDFLRGLIEDYKLCYYKDCKVKLQYIEYSDDLATIERINNSIGHIKSNCVLACMRCNKSKKSSVITV